MKTLHGLMIAGGVLLLSACGKAPVDTVEVKAGTMQTFFSETAMTTIDTITTINLPAPGKLEPLPVKVGADVKKGQVLGTLELLPMQVAVHKTEKELIATERAYQAQQEKTKGAQASLNLAKLNLARDEKLIQNKSVSQQVLDDAKSTYLNAVADFNEAQKLEQALFAALQGMKANLRLAHYHLKNATLSAPVDGVVLSEATKGNEWLDAGALVMTIANPKLLEASAMVLSVDAQKLKVGDHVELGTDGYTYPFRGVVMQIYPAAITKRSALGVDEQRVKVIIRLLSAKTMHVGVGYRLYAKFITKNIANAVMVPRESVLQDAAGNYYVYVEQKDKRVKTRVEVGAVNDDVLQIVSGLQAGAHILRSPTVQTP